MKIIAGIRLLLAAALMALLSGTMAFAHSGHEHAASVSSDSTEAAQARVSAAQSLASHHINQTLSAEPQPQGPVVSATGGTFNRAGGCGSGSCGAGCCCNGPASCGMAGFCSALAIPPADQQVLVVRDQDIIPIAPSEAVAGGILFDLDRPPKI